MRRWLHGIEVFVDRIIPYIVLLLIFIIIGEFAFHDFIERYRLYVSITDYIIIGFFVVDLCFKFYRIRNAKLFLKKYWLEIIAVFPFILIFRLFEEISIIFRLTEPLDEGQKVLHSITEIGKIGEEQKIIRELQELKEGTRLSRTSRFLRFFRLPRLARAVPIYEKPIKKEIKVIKKDIKKVERELGFKKRR